MVAKVAEEVEAILHKDRTASVPTPRPHNMTAVERDEGCAHSGALPYPATRPRDMNRGKNEGIWRHLEEIIRLQGEILYHQRQVIATQFGETACVEH